MTEVPETVIEEYLALVNECLPESISEEVITELRTYMIETARDIGGGEITLQSAKKVVAQFGAPSEVADEYKYSMLPETIPLVPSAPSDEEPNQEDVQDSVIEQRKQKPRKESTSSSIEAFLQTTAIAVAWSLVVVFASTLIGPVWIWMYPFQILMVQLILVVCSIAVVMYYRRAKNSILWKRTYPEWSTRQKFFTLPENVFKEAPDFLIVIDILGALAGAVIFLLSASYSESMYYIPIIVIPTSIALLAKSFYSGKRIGSQNPLRNIKAEVASTFVALLLIDSAQIWIMSYSLSFVLLLFRGYTVIWGAVLLLQLVARSGDLWWDTADSETTLTRDDKTIILHQISYIGGTTILRLVGWIVFFSLIPTYCLMISKHASTLWFAPLWIALFFGPIFLSPTILYFIYRRWRVQRGTSKSVIGERSRFEALGDLLLTSYILFGFISSMLIFTNPNFLSDQFHYVFNDFGSTGAFYFLTGYLSSNLLLLIGLSFRMLGDCLEFGANRRIATEIMVISGIILIISITLRVGIDTISYDYLLFPFYYYPVILFLAVVIAFQVETSRLKLKELNDTSLTYSSDSHEIRDPRMEIRSSVHNTEPKRRYLGN